MFVSQIVFYRIYTHGLIKFLLLGPKRALQEIFQMEVNFILSCLN